MTSRQEAYAAAASRAPVYYAEAIMPWEERLARAHTEASKALGATLPPNSVANGGAFEQALTASDMRIDADTSGLTASLAAGEDLPAGAEFQYTTEQSRNLYWGKFSIASTGLGAYLTGEMREQVRIGTLSSTDFESGAAARLRTFSEIIHLGRTGALSAAVNGENFSRAEGSSIIRIGSNDIISTPQPATGAGGLGWLVYAAIAIGASLVVAGVVCYFKYSSDVTKTRNLALEVCKEAVSKGNPNANAICANMTDVANKTGAIEPPSLLPTIFGKEQVDAAVKWGLVIGAGALVVAFAPSIIRNLSAAGDALSQAQARRLARQMEGMG